MSKPKFWLEKKAVFELMKSASVRSMLRSKGEAVASRAGEGFVCELREGPKRVRAVVRPTTFKARRKQAKEHVLERALGGGL